MYDESFFTIEGNAWQHQQSYYESKDHAATDDVKFIHKTKFPAKIFLWVSMVQVNQYFAVNKELYIFKCLPVLHKFIQKHHKEKKKSYAGLIWRLHIMQRIRWFN
jgi:hypothetical protein